MKLIIDDREPKSITDKLSDHFDVEVKRLDIGDYLYGDIVIERKEANDFLNSLFDTRLFTQAREMSEYAHPFLLVHGNVYKSLAKRRMKRDANNVLDGAIASLVYDFGLVPLFCDDEKEFINRLKYILNRTKETETRVHSKKYKKNRTPREVQIDMLCCIDKVGRKKAEMVLDIIRIDYSPAIKDNYYFDDVEAIKKDLLEIEGIGKKLADNIMKVIE